MSYKRVVWLVIGALLLPTSAFGLGLGAIELKSALNQPLSAEIPLLSVREQDVSRLKIKLANREAFERAGIDRSVNLTQINFKVVKKGTRYVLEASTRQPIQEPFLNFLIEVDWTQGKLLREYTLLLDPPVTAATFKPSTQRSTSASASSSSSTNNAARTAVSSSVRTAPARSVARPSAQTTTTRTTVAPGFSGDQYRVKRNQTLWNIAKETQAGDVTTEQMIMALYRANPDAFNRGDINSLRAGRILRVPDASEAKTLSVRDARQQFAQAAGGGSTASAAPVSARTATTSNRPATSASSSGSSAGAASTTDGQLRIVAPTDAKAGSVQGAGGQDASNAPVTALQRDLAIARESIASQKTENDDLRSKLNELEEQQKSLERLLALKDQQLEALQTQMAGGATAPPPVETEQTSEPAIDIKQQPEQAAAQPPVDTAPTQPVEEPQVATSEPEPPAPPIAPPMPPKPIAPPATPAEAPSLFNPLFIAIGGGVVLIIVIVGYLVMRSMGRSGEDEDDAEEVDEIDDQALSGVQSTITSIERAGSSVGQFDVSDKDDEPTEVEKSEETEFGAFVDDGDDEGGDPFKDDADAISEAEVYLAYGRHEQAVEVLQNAIKEHPAKMDLRQKLLEVLHQAGDLDGFEQAAQAYYNKAQNPASGAWAEIVQWAQQMGSTNALFTDGGAQVTAPAAMEEPVAPTAAATEASDDLSFDIDLDSELGGDEDFQFNEAPAELDFGGSEAPVDTSADDSFAPMDFTTSKEAEPEDDNTLDFVGGSFDASTSDDELLSVLDDITDDGDSMDVDLSALEDDDNLDNILDFQVDDTGLEAELESSIDTAVLDDLTPDADDTDLVADSGDEIGTKLDLARAYIEMGDADGARAILNEVVDEGDATQKSEAQELISSLAS